MKTKPNRLVAGMFLAATSSALAATHYVWQRSPEAAPPYTNWVTAATNIQDAVDAAVAGDEIVVTNGTYASGSRVDPNGVTNRLAVTRPLTVRSVNGPDVTVIDGSGTVRCVYLTNDAAMVGFTLTNGVAQVNNGGGLYCESSSTVVSNCVLTRNSANSGGGAYGGTLNNCTFTGNTAHGHVEPGGPRPLLVWPWPSRLPPWGFPSYLLGLGGGAYGGALNNCTLTSNRASDFGGGACGGTLNNCTLTANAANSGGGASGCTLNNCIVHFNSVYFDADPNQDNYDPWSTLNYCCASPQPTNGIGNIDADPQFVDYAGGNLRLRPDSPCINAGNNAYATNGVIDLDRNPRISGGVVDMGAYEFVFTPSMEVGQLMLWVNDSELGTKNKQPLLATLTAALASFDRGNVISGANQLAAFQNKVRAQIARIDAELGNELIATAQRIIQDVTGRELQPLE